MNSVSKMNLKTRALIATTGILLMMLGVNIYINMYFAMATYREALLARTTTLAEVIKKDIDKALDFGLSLPGLAGIGEKLSELADRDKDISYALVMDMDGRVLYASDRKAENTVRTDEATKGAFEASSPMVQRYADAQGSHYEKVFPLLSPEKKKVGVFRIGLNPDAVSRQVRGPVLLSLAVGLVSFVLAIVFVYLFVGKGITVPISEMSQIAGRLATGDLAGKISVSGQAEVAALGTAINALSSNLRDMLGKLRQTVAGLGEAVNSVSAATYKMSGGARVQQEATEQTVMTVEEMVASIRGVADNAEVMSNSATNASSAVAEMATSIGEIAKSTNGLSAIAEETASSIQQMLASVRQVSENTEALSSSAEETSSSLTEMSASVKEVEQRAVESARLAESVSREASERGVAAAEAAIKGMDNIRATVEAASTVVNRLGKRSQAIGQILKVIDEVTDQTGLLALNAAILASQAGEHGKGFSVIAEEIKELAERTAASTQEIAGLIAAVQKDTEETVQAMGKGLKAVVDGADLVSVTRDVLGQVVESSQQSSKTAELIKRTTAEQARGLSQITEAVVGITNQIEHISQAMQEQRRGSEQISKAAEKMREITHRVQYATNEQTTGSKQITGAVESVTTQAAQIARSTSEQKQGAGQISTAVASIQKITVESVDLSIEIDIAMQALRERADELRTALGKFTL